MSKRRNVGRAYLRGVWRQTRWIYCEPVTYPSHARLLVPLQLAVVALKCYWSGQITPTEILET